MSDHRTSKRQAAPPWCARACCRPDGLSLSIYARARDPSPSAQMLDSLCRTAWRSAQRRALPASCRCASVSLFGGRATVNGLPIPAFPTRSAGHNQRMRLVPWIPPRFRDRAAAGRVLSEAVAALQLDQPVVVGVARGGGAVALEVAREFEAPLTCGCRELFPASQRIRRRRSGFWR